MRAVVVVDGWIGRMGCGLVDLVRAWPALAYTLAIQSHPPHVDPSPRTTDAASARPAVSAALRRKSKSIVLLVVVVVARDVGRLGAGSPWGSESRPCPSPSQQQAPGARSRDRIHGSIGLNAWCFDQLPTCGVKLWAVADMNLASSVCI